MVLKKVLFCSFLFFSLVNLCPAQDHEPDLNWRTLRTKNFSIHFPQNFEKLALKIGNICEEVYDPIGRSLNYFPKHTHVVIHTRSDFSNGLASPLPWRMELYITEPLENWIGVGDDWLRLLITHEFTHIVQLRKTRGLSRVTYPLFGELNSFWQGITPHWFIEGIATLNETKYTNGGRGRNPFHFMEMSAPVVANNPWTLERTNYLSRKKLPLGMFYVSGYFLSNYIQNQTSPDVWQKTMDVYSSFPLLGFNHAIKKVTGKNQQQFYDEMIEKIDKRNLNIQFSTSSIEIWSAKNENSSTEKYLLTRPPTNEYSPRWFYNNDIIFYRSGFDKLPGLVQINYHGETKKLVERRLTGQTNSFSIGQHYLVWAELKTHPRFSATVYSDIKLLNLQNHQVQKVTHNSRLYSLDLSPDETKLVAVQNVLPKTRLVTVELNSGKIEPLLEIKNATIMNPRWSFDGMQVVFAVKDSIGRQNVALFEMGSKTWRYLAEPDDQHDNNPCFTPDGKTVLFTSDRSGIYNIWAIEIKTGQKWEITNVPLGAFSPDVSADGKKVAFNLYTYSGFVVATIPLDKKMWISEKSIQRFQLSNSLRISGIANLKKSAGSLSKFQTKKYNPSSQLLRPQGWLPMVFKFDDEYSPGLFALSEDVLHRHYWQAGVGYSLESKKPFYDLFYQYSRFWPRVGVDFYNTPRKVMYKNHTGWWHKQGIVTSVSVPLTLESNVYTTVLQPFIGYKYENQKQAVGVLFPLYEKYRGFRTGLQFFRASQTFRDVVPHQLTSFSISYDWTGADLNSQYKGHQLSAQLNLIFPTFIKHHQLQFFTAYQGRRSTYPFGASSVIPIGYDDNGKYQLFRFKTEYHFPIAFLEWPIPFLPIYFDYISGSVFHDWSTSWNHGSGRDRWVQNGKASTGIKLILSTLAFQYVPVHGSLAFFYRSLFEDLSVKADVSIDFSY